MAVEDPQDPFNPQASAPPEEQPYPSERYAWYVVAVLMIVYIFSFVDRQILGLLVGPMKEDLGISDTQMSYLMGIYFALFYTVFGIPMGRLADSKSRRTLIAVGLTVWSIMSAGCGLAKTYSQLALLRFGVGIGEATLSPSAYSLISDYFRPTRLAFAISVYGAGIYIGSGMAYLLGGYIVGWASGHEGFTLPVFGDIRAWQLVFLIIGIPGVFFALALLTIKEPVRRGVGKSGKSVPLRQVLDYIGQNRRTFACHCIGFALLSFISYGSGSWIPTFLIRLHELSPRDAGIRYGTIVMVFGTLGIMSGGFFADKLAQRGWTDAKMRVGLIAAAAHIPLGILFPLMPNSWLVLLLLMPSVYTAAMPFGVAPAAIQEMMPNRLRGQAAAIYLFIVNIIGLGAGPTAVAWSTDLLFKDEMRVNHSLVLVSTVAGLVACGLLFSGLRPFRESLAYRDAWQAGEIRD